MNTWDGICSLTQDEGYRRELREEGIYKLVFMDMRDHLMKTKTLQEIDRISWMTTLICFYEDMVDLILDYDILELIYHFLNRTPKYNSIV